MTSNLLNDVERTEKIVDVISDKNYMTDHGLGSFPDELILAMAKHESPLDFNNEFRAGDWGRGIMQITDNGLVKTDGNCKNRINSSYECQKIYSNTNEGLNKNIGDGIATLQGKYTDAKSNSFISKSVTKEECPSLSENLTIESNDFLHMSTLNRYNGIQFQAQAIYKVYSGSSASAVLQYFQEKYGYFPTFRSTFNNTKWLNYVGDVCKTAVTFSDCWKSLSLEKNKKPNSYNETTFLVNNYLYLNKIASNLGMLMNTANTKNWKNKLICTDTSSLITFIASPASLVIKDASGNEAGMRNGRIVSTLANAWVDPESEVISMYFPPNDHEKKAASPRKMKDAMREAAGRGRSNF